MASHGVGYLLLEFPQVFSLCSYPSPIRGSVPGCDEHTGLFTRLDRKDDFIHTSNLPQGVAG